MSGKLGAKTDQDSDWRQGLLQSRSEWDTRNDILGTTICQLIATYLKTPGGRGLDVGCQSGPLTDVLAANTTLKWWGIDPVIKKRTITPHKATLLNGTADRIPFPGDHFDCCVLANVFEHIQPDLRSASLAAMYRVLVKDGILVGQLPNPYFPIESHSRLPFMGWLPISAQRVYWRLAPVSWEHDFFVVTINTLRRQALEVGFEAEMIRVFNYPREVIPQSIRWAYDIFKPVMQVVPWAWQFVLRKV